MAVPDGSFHYASSDRVSDFQPVLRTKRLTLTIVDPENDEDCDIWINIFKDPSVKNSMGGISFNTREQMKAFLTSITLLPEHTPLRKPVSGPALYVARLGVDNPQGSGIGGFGLCSRHPDLPADVSWCLLTEHQGKGYSSEAALPVVDYFLDEFQGGFRNSTPPCGMTSLVNAKNKASAAVARKVGLVDMGYAGLLGANDTFPVYGIPGLNINNGNPFTGDPKVNVFGYGEPGRVTTRLIFGQDSFPEGGFSDEYPD